MGQMILGYVLGITPREGSETGLGRWKKGGWKESCDIPLMGTSGDPTGICEDGMTLQSSPKWGERAECSHPRISQSFNADDTNTG